MFVHAKRYIVNIDQIAYIDPGEGAITVHFVGGGKPITIDRNWLTPESADALGLNSAKPEPDGGFERIVLELDEEDRRRKQADPTSQQR